MKNYTPVFASLLMISLACCAYLYSEKNACKCNVNVPGPYTGNYAINRTKANDYIRQFDQVELNDSIKGGIITRSVFDELLCNENVNGIAYRFGVDTMGEAGHRNRGIFLILKGVNVVYDQQGDSVRTTNPVETSIYSSRNWCPTACMNF